MASRETLEPRAAARPRLGGSSRSSEGSPGAIIGESSGLILRFARDDDADAIIALISSVWSEYPGKTLMAAADMPELLAPASAYAKGGGRFWVVEANPPSGRLPRSEIIGTIALTPSAEPGVVELQKLYVARGVRKNGLGSFLCHLVEREARERGAHAIELWSDVKLLDAHHRYERLGYRRGEELKTYADTSGTVRYYYRKALDRELPDRADRPADAGDEAQAADRLGIDRWHALLQLGAGEGTQLGAAKS